MLQIHEIELHFLKFGGYLGCPNRTKIPSALQTRPESDFLRFLFIFGAPGASQNPPQIAKILKKRQKIDIKK